jgi:hypothetical protein
MKDSSHCFEDLSTNIRRIFVDVHFPSLIRAAVNGHAESNRRIVLFVQLLHHFDASSNPKNHRNGHAIAESLVTRAIGGGFAADSDCRVSGRKSL